MAKEAVAKTRRNRMDQQQKTTRKSGETNLRSTQSQSLLNVNELETRAKATVKDISDLYAALQGLVPKKSPHNGRKETGKSKARSATSGTDTDTARSSEEWDQPKLRRYHSEKYAKRQLRDTNMNFVATARKPVWEKPVQEKQVLEKTLSLDERLFVSDTEVELNNSATNEHKQIQRHLSLPAYEEEEDSLKTLNEADGSTKRSKFSIFRRRQRSKTGKKKTSSWRSFFSTLSLKRKKSKKSGKNKIGHGTTTTTKAGQNDNTKTQKHLAKKGSGSTEERSPKPTPRPSIDVGSNSVIRKSGRKGPAPEPPVETPSGNTSFQRETVEPRERVNTFGTKTDLVQKKFTAWYKQAVKETNSSLLKEPLRATRSHENLLTDTEILRKRNGFSSDTDSTSFSGGDRNRLQNVPRTKVRKTRARRNRRRERARFHSCPNVKLVTKALDEAEKKADRVPADLDTTTKDDCTDNVSQMNHTCITTVKPVEAKLSFGSSLENDEPGIDSMKEQHAHARDWMTRQCSKTTIGCIRPLQLNLFYSESPSRETVHSMIHSPKGEQSGAGNPHEFAFKIRRSSSRRRKRRSFKRTRLPHQSPFYVPPVTTLNVTTKDQPEENCSTISKDSGLGSPDVVTHDKRFGTFPIMKRDQRLAKLHSESEDSGWASSYRHIANTSDTGIQTDPVIVMTAVSKVRRPILPHVISEDNSQSEA